jgi:hypothetical protein
MAKSDGSLNKITKHQKTRILPLRWIGNICGEFASSSLVKVLDLDEDGDFGYRFKFHSKVWKYLDKPYRWWGTYYILTDSESQDS